MAEVARKGAGGTTDAYCPHCFLLVEEQVEGEWPATPTRCPHCRLMIGMGRARPTPAGNPDLVYGSAADADLLRRYHEGGDVRARQSLIERHIGFVRRLAQRYAHRGETLDDLTQVGCVGLIKAIDRFDGHYRVTLATYAA